jgi:hypothetical protein
MRIWPVLDWSQWQACGDTLHMLTQIVGKTRLALTPMQNHWWNVPLYLSAHGLTTSVMPLPNGDRLEIEFDFRAHRLAFFLESGRAEYLPLEAQPVNDFYEKYLLTLRDLEVQAAIHPQPVEVADGIRFDEDSVHRDYDPDAVSRFWQVLSAADTLLKLQAEAYSHECISAGFWPGNGGYGRPAFYSYAAPVPQGLSAAVIAGGGRFDQTLGEFILDYDEVRAAEDPERMLLDFLQNTYSACADAARWDRENLDRNTLDQCP